MVHVLTQVMIYTISNFIPDYFPIIPIHYGPMPYTSPTGALLTGGYTALSKKECSITHLDKAAWSLQALLRQ